MTVGSVYRHPMSLFAFLIIFLIFLANVVNDIYLPSLPRLTKDLQCTDQHVVLTMTSFCLGVVVAEIFFGHLVNRKGKRFALYSSASIFLAGIIWARWCGSVQALIIARFIQGVGVSGLNVSAIAIAKDNFTKRDSLRFISFMTMTGAIAPLIGPVIGGYIDTYYSWRFNFQLLAISTFAAMILLLPSSAKIDHQLGHPVQGKASLPFGEILRLTTGRETAALFTGLFLLVFCLVAYLVYSPFLFIEKLGFSSKDYGLMQLPVFAVYLIGLLFNGKIAARVSSVAITNFCILMLIFAAGLIAWQSTSGIFTYLGTCLAMSLFSAVYGFFVPLLISQITLVSNATSGATSTAIHLAMSLGSLAGALVYGIGMEKHLVFLAAFVMTSCILSIIVKKQETIIMQLRAN